MVHGLIGRKLGMTQIFDEQGLARPVTVIEAGPCVITQIRNAETDGYEAVQLGFGIAKKLNKPGIWPCSREWAPGQDPSRVQVR